MTASEPVFYDHVLEGLARAVGERASPQLKNRLTSLGLAFGGKQKATFSLNGWRELLRACREELQPGVPENAAYQQLGEDVARAYFKGLMGSALAGVARLLGPRRTLARATQSFRSANNFTETRLTQIGPTEFELWLNEVDQPDFTAGVISEGLRVSGAKRVSVVPGDWNGHSATYKVQWSAS